MSGRGVTLRLTPNLYVLDNPFEVGKLLLSALETPIEADYKAGTPLAFAWGEVDGANCVPALDFEDEAGLIAELQSKVFRLGVSAGGGVDYSTTEQDTGRKWVDGKAIYSRVLLVEADNLAELLPDAGNTSRTFVLEDEIDSYISIFGLHISDNETLTTQRLEILSGNGLAGTVYILSYQISSEEISIVTDDDTYLLNTFPCRIFLRLEYTKKQL
jgi:hypothetical protein